MTNLGPKLFFPRLLGYLESLYIMEQRSHRNRLAIMSAALPVQGSVPKKSKNFVRMSERDQALSNLSPREWVSHSLTAHSRLFATHTRDIRHFSVFLRLTHSLTLTRGSRLSEHWCKGYSGGNCREVSHNGCWSGKTGKNRCKTT